MARHLLSPRMAALLGRIEKARTTPFHAMTPQQARAAYGAAAEVLDFPREPLSRVETHGFSAGEGLPLAMRLYAPSRERLPVLLYLHGGGFMIGGLETHDSLCRQLARRTGCAVVALEYRLAPEHAFPAAVDDTWAVLRRLPGWAEQQGLDGSRIAVGGDSAGGTLAAVAAIQSRAEGLPLAMQLLITPGTASHPQWPSRQQFAQGFLLESETIEWFFSHLLPPAARSDWRFAPLEAPDLDGVAPAHLVLAECDPLLDEGLAYGDRLRAAGVAVELHLARGVTHDFIKMGRALPEAGHALDACAAALREAFAKPPPTGS